MQTPRITPEQAHQIGDALAEQGRVMATLDDWRAILFVAFLFIVALIATVVVLLRANRLERSDMAKERERMWAVADKFGAAAGQLTGELQVQQALNARVEAALGRCEELLKHLDQSRGKRGPDDMRFMEAVMKLLWGTDTKCSSQHARAQGAEMVADAERKVDALQQVLNERPARDLDEALYQMTRGERSKTDA
jgi:hypothetical protein